MAHRGPVPALLPTNGRAIHNGQRLGREAVCAGIGERRHDPDPAARGHQAPAGREVSKARDGHRCGAGSAREVVRTRATGYASISRDPGAAAKAECPELSPKAMRIGPGASPGPFCLYGHNRKEIPKHRKQLSSRTGSQRRVGTCFLMKRNVGEGRGPAETVWWRFGGEKLSLPRGPLRARMAGRRAEAFTWKRIRTTTTLAALQIQTRDSKAGIAGARRKFEKTAAGGFSGETDTIFWKVPVGTPLGV